MEEIPKKQKFALLGLSDGQKSAMSTKLIEEFRADTAYWIEIILSSIIASLGLLQNSIAIVIGAMLIAPLFRPIELLAFGITTGQSSNITRGLRIILISVMLAVGIGFLTASLVPLQIETVEILARTTPNLLDLFIALASAIVVFLSLSSTRYSESVAGVAMSAALLPPLAVAGIELAFHNYAQFSGSLFLFFTNLVAIVFVGIIMFFLYGFAPNQRFKQINAFKDITILLLLIGLISIPLVSSLQKISTRISIELKAKNYLENVLSEKIPNAKLSELKLLNVTNDSAQISGTIRIPQGSEFYLETKNAIADELGQSLSRKVDLKIDIIPVASIISETQKSKPDPVDVISTQFRDFLKEKLPTATIVKLEVADVTKEAADTSKMAWAIKPIITLTPGESLTKDEQQQLIAGFQAKLQVRETANIIWTIIPQYSETDIIPKLTPAEIYHQDLILRFHNFFDQNIVTNADITNLTIKWQNIDTNSEFELSNITKYTIGFDIKIPATQQDQLDAFQADLENFAKQIFNQEATINMRVFPYNSRSLTLPQQP
ncbi:TIGR00341 family protein [Candidatus Peregrinibacteria bacterium CG11_big_fil_rev_8_21_14_0_20_41_10]|nr:MAG: TIGR00341 family protein [Candidatus Peregrinibacteria bacterium CG11_big_fil_rev_8_21_14_0_20_41_10]PIZ73926.1 MAG: TIGR00341 family protein [Candidatus Peregrinibacteria bacterium CG_4_10_14_0_2_um_filter_41_8]PJC37890.1 MAG: TIGR00341 family protein [Candidatus Peregrinibacteria bacterium CG_4_9_14_0_2_um_filter_41_14]